MKSFIKKIKVLASSAVDNYIMNLSVSIGIMNVATDQRLDAAVTSFREFPDRYIKMAKSFGLNHKNFVREEWDGTVLNHYYKKDGEDYEVTILLQDEADPRELLSLQLKGTRA